MTYFVRAHDSNSTLNLTIKGTSYVGSLVASYATETLSNIRFENYHLWNNIRRGDAGRWGFQLFNLVNCVFADGLVEDMYGEHNGYLHSPRGDLTFTNHRGHRAGAQDIQIVYRDPESDTPGGWQVTGLHLIEGGETVSCGLPRGSGRASYAISRFGRQTGDGSTPRQAWDCPLRIKDRLITHTTQGQPAGWLLNGAILCEWAPRFELLGGKVDYDGPADQDLVHAHMNEEVIVDGTEINGAKHFSITGVASGRTKLIDISNVTGHCNLSIDGKKIGLLNQGYRWAA